MPTTLEYKLASAVNLPLLSLFLSTFAWRYSILVSGCMEILLHQPRQRRSYRHMEILWDCDLFAMLQVSYTYNMCLTKKKNNLNLSVFMYYFSLITFMFVIIMVSCYAWVFMISVIVIFTYVILMISVHLLNVHLFCLYSFVCLSACRDSII